MSRTHCRKNSPGKATYSFADRLSAWKPFTYSSFQRFHQRLRFVDRSMVGLMSLNPACTRSAGTLPSVSTKRSTLKYSLDRKSTRLNSSHVAISYAVFCLKKKKKKYELY